MSRPLPHTSFSAALLLSLLLVASSTSAEGLAPEQGLTDFAALKKSAPGFPICESKPTKPPGKAKWRSKRNRFLTAMASPLHAAEDAVVTPGATVELRAKFTYGRVSKDLNGEDVLVAVHDCSGWKAAGEARTDDDGWLKLTTTAPDKPGVYAVSYTVKGDRSQVFGRLWVLPKGKRLVVIDIDGTLTTDDDQIKNEVLDDHFNKIGSGKHDPKKYPYAVELTHAIAARGDAIVYLSGRPYWLVPHSRHWLDKHGFAPGAVIHTRTHREVAPEVAGVGEYKRDNMLALKKRGFELAEAYGNAQTDVWAYDEAGISHRATWIIGPEEDKAMTNDVEDSWEDVVKGIGKPAAPTPQRAK